LSSRILSIVVSTAPKLAQQRKPVEGLFYLFLHSNYAIFGVILGEFVDGIFFVVLIFIIGYNILLDQKTPGGSALRRGHRGIFLNHPLGVL